MTSEAKTRKLKLRKEPQISHPWLTAFSSLIGNAVPKKKQDAHDPLPPICAPLLCWFGAEASLLAALRIRRLRPLFGLDIWAADKEAAPTIFLDTLKLLGSPLLLLSYWLLGEPTTPSFELTETRRSFASSLILGSLSGAPSHTSY